MPFAPPRVCQCGRVVPYGTTCPCKPARTKATRAAYDAQRGSATARGYDAAWQRLRIAHLSDSPLCVHCLQEDETVTMADDVDHIVPIAVDPTKRLSPDNLQSLCRMHHNRKTASERR